jgi:hypothetical protein
MNHFPGPAAISWKSKGTLHLNLAYYLHLHSSASAGSVCLSLVVLTHDTALEQSDVALKTSDHGFQKFHWCKAVVAKPEADVG